MRVVFLTMITSVLCFSCVSSSEVYSMQEGTESSFKVDQKTVRDSLSNNKQEIIIESEAIKGRIESGGSKLESGSKKL